MRLGRSAINSREEYHAEADVVAAEAGRAVAAIRHEAVRGAVLAAAPNHAV